VQHDFLATAAARLPGLDDSIRRRRLARPALRTIARRLAHFWVVWSVLLFVHEAGHAVVGVRQGLVVERVTVGAGPIVWSGARGETELVLRLVPLVGVTRLSDPVDGSAAAGSHLITDWAAWRQEAATLGGGIAATFALALALAGLVALRERRSRTRWTFGRILVADALVLTVFNFLPVPPLDGGRAAVGAMAAWRGAPLPPEVLFWVQLGGFALAVVPMMLWTRWTARIDALAMRWGAPSAQH
jgi:membrane-associated protease RseP (regulator of RpoE activity)